MKNSAALALAVGLRGARLVLDLFPGVFDRNRQTDAIDGQQFNQPAWGRTSIALTTLPMRHTVGVIVLLGALANAQALTPRPDNSPDLFAGEWAGTGGFGSYCYLHLDPDHRGTLLIDAGSGDWLGARLQWRNEQQNLVVESLVPLPLVSARRVLPLTQAVIRTGVNLSLSLRWSAAGDECKLQRAETLARHLNRAREVIDRLPAGDAGR